MKIFFKTLTLLGKRFLKVIGIRLLQLAQLVLKTLKKKYSLRGSLSILLLTIGLANLNAQVFPLAKPVPGINGIQGALWLNKIDMNGLGQELPYYDSNLGPVQFSITKYRTDPSFVNPNAEALLRLQDQSNKLPLVSVLATNAIDTAMYVKFPLLNFYLPTKNLNLLTAGNFTYNQEMAVQLFWGAQTVLDINAQELNWHGYDMNGVKPIVCLLSDISNGNDSNFDAFHHVIEFPASASLLQPYIGFERVARGIAQGIVYNIPIGNQQFDATNEAGDLLEGFVNIMGLKAIQTQSILDLKPFPWTMFSDDPANILSAIDPKGSGQPNAIGGQFYFPGSTRNNASILSFWHMLLCEGGNGFVDDNPAKPQYNVASLGPDQNASSIFVAKTLLKTLANWDTSEPLNFETLKFQMLTNLISWGYPEGSPQYTSFNQAFIAIGVSTKATAHDYEFGWFFEQYKNGIPTIKCSRINVNVKTRYNGIQPIEVTKGNVNPLAKTPLEAIWARILDVPKHLTVLPPADYPRIFVVGGAVEEDPVYFDPYAQVFVDYDGAQPDGTYEFEGTSYVNIPIPYPYVQFYPEDAASVFWGLGKFREFMKEQFGYSGIDPLASNEMVAHLVQHTTITGYLNKKLRFAVEDPLK